MTKNKREVIINLLKNNVEGLTITGIVIKSKLSRSLVRTILARLEGAKKVNIRKVGMSKVYTFVG